MFETLFGADTPLAVRFFIAFLIVLALIGGTAWLVRRFGSDRLGGASIRGRQPRLAIIDAASIDSRRRLVLIRRDNVEHLLMIGGPTDVVVEANIVRAAAATTREMPRVAEEPAVPRPAAVGETTMWPLQPQTEPAARPARPEVTEEPMQWPAQPQRPAAQRRPVDTPLAGLAEELSARPLPKREPQVAAGGGGRGGGMPPQLASRPSIAAATPEAPPSNPDQNLAEMAQRLEAALRRPKPGEARAAPPKPPAEAQAVPPMEVVRPSAPRLRTEQEPMHPAPRIRPEAEPPPAPLRGRAEPEPAHAEPEEAARQEAPPEPVPLPVRPPEAEQKPARSKNLYDSLEQEMASLLGRPAGKP